MASRADDRSRALGGVVVVAAVLAGFLFLAGLAARSYWALAIPVAAGFLFVLSLVIWIGWTIATVQTSASGDALPAEGNPSSATTALNPDPDPERT
jgi:cell division protein FtsW (lipid II flippase)